MFKQAEVTDTHRREFAALQSTHARAARVTQRSPIGGTDREVAAEDNAWNAMVDYIEANELSYTELDPRGTDDPTDEDLRGQS